MNNSKNKYFILLLLFLISFSYLANNYIKNCRCDDNNHGKWHLKGSEISNYPEISAINFQNNSNSIDNSLASSYYLLEFTKIESDTDYELKLLAKNLATPVSSSLHYDTTNQILSTFKVLKYP